MVTKASAPAGRNSAGRNSAGRNSAGRNSAGRIVPLFRPYRLQVAGVVALIVVTSTIGIINPLLIQAVFNKALFVPGGPKVKLLVILVAIMAVVPIIDGAIGILQTLPLAFFTGIKTGEIQSRLANDVGGVESVVTTTASTILANVVTFIHSASIFLADQDGRRA